MNLARDDVPEEVSRALGGLPVRWAPANAAAGDYDGRDRTLEVFLADAAEQREILGILRPERPRLEAAAGGAIIIVFHTRAETRRLYADFVDSFPHACHYTVEVNFDGKRKFFCDLCGGAFQ